MRLRQVALVAQELRPVVDNLAFVFGLDRGYNDPGVGKYGLENAVLPIGDTFLEVVVPVREGTTAGRYLERRHGDGGYMVILQVPDFAALAAARERVEACQVRVVDRMDSDKAAFTHLHPRDVGGAILSVDAMYPPEHWEWAGPNWKHNVHTESVSGIAGVEIQAADPAAMAARWGEVLGLAAAAAEGDAHVIALDGGAIRFVGDRDGRADGVSAVDLDVIDAEGIRGRAATRGLLHDDGSVTICGTRFNVIPVTAAASAFYQPRF